MRKREYAAALKFVNEVRVLIGKKPVKRLQKGQRRKTYSCVVARTIDKSGRVAVADTSDGVEVSGLQKFGLTPSYQRKRSAMVRDFINGFDRGKAPELEL